MSTILDALRKAQEETGNKRQAPVGEHPAASEAVAPARQRRRVGWPVAVVGILGLAFAGGLAFGDRISAWLGGTTDVPAPATDVQVAMQTDPAATAPAIDGDVKQQTDAAPRPASPAVRRGKSPEKGDAAATRRGSQPAAAAPAAGQGGTPEVAPSPYGQLHVFGAGERPAGEKPSADERLARLQQLREKMLKARKDSAARGTQEDVASAPAQIFVPPPREAAPSPASGAKPTAAAVAAAERAGSSPTTTEGASPPAGVVHETTVDVAPAEVARPAETAPQPVAEESAPEPAVGVSVANARAEAADAEITDPDIAPVAAAPAVATDPAAAQAAAPEPVAVAALTPPEPAPAAAPQPVVAAAAPPVLRRAPGGAPQVAINILQWSAEPARRFAFVSVDGGNMTQVREGDRIGGLTIKHIHQQMIEFGFNDATFLLRAN